MADYTITTYLCPILIPVTEFEGLDNLPEIAGMAMMGAGGGISIIGGILFVIVMIKSFKNKVIA